MYLSCTLSVFTPKVYDQVYVEVHVEVHDRYMFENIYLVREAFVQRHFQRCEVYVRVFWLKAST